MNPTLPCPCRTADAVKLEGAGVSRAGVSRAGAARAGVAQAVAERAGGEKAGSAPAYAACCGRYHEGPLHLQAPDAESLMRSRYSAFVLDLTGYLLATWHSSTRPASLEPNPPGAKWLGLDVKRQVPIDTHHATVEFVARSKMGGRAQRLHETSRFVREQGRWYYVDGDLH